LNVPDNYEKFNPANFAGEWQTPALIIHGGKDYRISISQGIGAFTALQRRGIPSKLLYFPEEKSVIAFLSVYRMLLTAVVLSSDDVQSLGIESSQRNYVVR
jgi:fermentation-respiration switch protein FrsA (DUF1100 family)